MRLSGFSTSQMLRGMNVDQTKRRVQDFCSAINMVSREGDQKKLDTMDLSRKFVYDHT